MCLGLGLMNLVMFEILIWGVFGFLGVMGLFFVLVSLLILGFIFFIRFMKWLNEWFFMISNIIVLMGFIGVFCIGVVDYVRSRICNSIRDFFVFIVMGINLIFICLKI